MTSIDTTLTVSRNDARSRYEIHVGPVLAGYTLFEPDGHDRLRFPHTVIDHAYRGKGLAGVLVGEALEDVARRGEIVVPLCPVVRKYVREHDVAGLVVDWPHLGDAQDAATGGEPAA